jgi:deazaflavin-dependent oxidoreductase (nitroreductase family)
MSPPITATPSQLPAGVTINHMATDPPVFREPTTVEKIFNRAFGFHNYLLEVRGRKSGKLFSTPVDLLELQGKRFLVAPRGRTQWVRNAEAAGEITLRRRSTRLKFRLRPLSDAEKPAILKAYLDAFKREVQTYFPVPAGSPPEAFASLLNNYPAFELQPLA